jgi:hypothetical protein
MKRKTLTLMLVGLLALMTVMPFTSAHSGSDADTVQIFYSVWVEPETEDVYLNVTARPLTSGGTGRDGGPPSVLRVQWVNEDVATITNLNAPSSAITEGPSTGQYWANWSSGLFQFSSLGVRQASIVVCFEYSVGLTGHNHCGNVPLSTRDLSEGTTAIEPGNPPPDNDFQLQSHDAVVIQGAAYSVVLAIAVGVLIAAVKLANPALGVIAAMISFAGFVLMRVAEAEGQSAPAAGLFAPLFIILGLIALFGSVASMRR